MEQPIIQQSAVKAVISYKNSVLILRESGHYEEGTQKAKYDFPGGRVKPGESWRTGLLREVEEESGLLDISIHQPIFIDEWFPVIKGVPHHIVGCFIHCTTTNPDVKLSKDHDDAQWVTKENYQNFPILTQTKNVLETFFA